MDAAASPAGWHELVDELEPLVPPDWTRQARDHGGQDWVRLILLVDAHHRLSGPGVTEKIAGTMAELAEGRGPEQEGWIELQTHGRDRRVAIVARLVDTAPDLLPSALVPLFARSIEPAPPG
jgi:hypothetical protein